MKTRKMKIHSRLLTAAASGLAPALFAPAAHAAWTLNLTPGIDQVSRDIYGLHMLAFWWSVGIAAVVFGFMIYSMVRFRHSKGAVPDTGLTHSTRVEVIWTTIPVLILISMAIPAARVLVETADTAGAQMSIRVTGYQWRWTYEYVGTPVKFVSSLDRRSDAARQLDSGIDPFSVPNYLLSVDHPLVVPAGVKVRVLVTGGDVIHSWWVPALGIKKDAIPGYVNEAWFDVDTDKLGTYRGQCAELCGRDHGFMPIVVQVVSKADFEKWLAQQEADLKKAPATAATTVTTALAAAPALDAAPAAPATAN
ncbi:MAG TPA: cytochrome c oxidase subunit II [Steroidobacteraceae bacterium]|jgi:cytochrome c oxidase subunit 2|nr:cytochrome c oxidase subunit II [Steroidobacteraceae bacterium]